MTAPLLARQDEITFSQLHTHLPHGLIIAGEAGLDRTALIDTLAKSVASDVQLIIPEKDKKYISVDQVRSLIASLRTHAHRRRVIIIRLAEYMTDGAQNALLKILEEPSQDTHFILESELPDQLLATILSRCQLFTLHRTSALQDNSLLKVSKLDDTAKQQIRFLAAGRPDLIRSLVRNPKMLDQKRDIIQRAKVILSGTSYEGFTVIAQYSKDRDQARSLLDVIVTLIHFQIKTKGVQPSLISLLQRAEAAQQAISSNGNTKLSLLRLLG